MNYYLFEPAHEDIPKAMVTANQNNLQPFSFPAELQNRDDVSTIKSQAWEQINFTAGKLTNNLWGAPSQELANSAVYLKRDGKFGWFWDRQSPEKSGLFVQPLYPNIRKGGSPWQATNCGDFPVKLADVDSLSLDVEFKYPVIPTGTYDLAYDIFLTEIDQPCTDPKLIAEIMIWLHATKEHTAITSRGIYSDGYNDYELHSYRMLDGRQYYAFVLQGKPKYSDRHIVNAKRLIDNLKLDPDLYIQGVELGNEVWDGSGKIEISRFDVIANGKTL